MAKSDSNSSKSSTKKDKDTPNTIKELINIHIQNKVKLKCKNKAQKDFSKLITDKEISIATGFAGTGKSFVSIFRAIELLQNKTTPYKKLIISKPIVDVEEDLGYLPGTFEEKTQPYMAPSIDIIDRIVGKETREKLEEEGIIEILPLAYIRGKTIENSILIMEEAQNTTPSQMKTLLTRIGDNSKFIISGDLDQSDRYFSFEKSGLFDIIKKHSNIDEVGVFQFGEEDIVRNPIITKILDNYSKEEKKEDKKKETKKTKPSFFHKMKKKIIQFFKKLKIHI